MDLVADDEPASAEELQTYVDDGRAFVATAGESAVAGYVLIDLVDGNAHVEQLSVDPEYGRQGLGSALLKRAEQWAAERGLGRITLCTFDEVPWNRPYYEQRGYRRLADHEVTPGLAGLRAHEAELGLDAWPRLCMARDL
ncbi:MAG TPA: GNAT family N-acetyltransferase [Mycobacteriales bacterium]|nr:GNAT family N-acetyltransferase [Mycobacteriales bacterium]